MTDQSIRVKDLGREYGFDLVRIGPATDLHVERSRYLEWVAEGRHGEMGWITPERVDRSSSPAQVHSGARSVVSVALAYWEGKRGPEPPMSGRVAHYAWGNDYHAVLGERLERFTGALRAEFGGETRWYVDTGPAMDKALAARSGLGWYGKNTNILTERFGSWVLLGEIITTLELPADEPLQRECGSCRLCVAACPTGALGPDYSIDSRRCISYLTIEHRDPIQRSLRSSMGAWVFGCDICQDVCPPSMAPHLKSGGERRAWAAEVRAYVGRTANAPPTAVHTDIGPVGAAPSGRPPPADGLCRPDSTGNISNDVDQDASTTSENPLFSDGVRQHLDLLWLLFLSHEEYLDAFRGTSIRRAKVWMLRRNAAVAVGNVGGIQEIEPLARAMREDEHPLVRGHAAWAVGQVGARIGEQRLVIDLLVSVLGAEIDETVCEEIRLALSELTGGLPV